LGSVAQAGRGRRSSCRNGATGCQRTNTLSPGQRAARRRISDGPSSCLFRPTLVCRVGRNDVAEALAGTAPLAVSAPTLCRQSRRPERGRRSSCQTGATGCQRTSTLTSDQRAAGDRSSGSASSCLFRPSLVCCGHFRKAIRPSLLARLCKAQTRGWSGSRGFRGC
jgi:hypothetical protein